MCSEEGVGGEAEVGLVWRWGFGKPGSGMTRGVSGENGELSWGTCRLRTVSRVQDFLLRGLEAYLGDASGLWGYTPSVMTLLSFPQGPPGPTGSLGHPGPPGVAVSMRDLWGVVTEVGQPGLQLSLFLPHRVLWDRRALRGPQ